MRNEQRRKFTRQFTEWRARLTRTIYVRLAGVAMLVAGLALLGFGTIGSPTISGGGNFKNVATPVLGDDNCQTNEPDEACTTTGTGGGSSTHSGGGSSTSAGGGSSTNTGGGSSTSAGGGSSTNAGTTSAGGGSSTSAHVTSAGAASSGSSSRATTSAGATSSRASGVAGVSTSTPKTGAGADVEFGLGLGLLIGGSALLFGARPVITRIRKAGKK